MKNINENLRFGDSPTKRNEPSSTGCFQKTTFLSIFVLVFLGFFFYQAYLNFFGYRGGDLTRHDARIRAQAEEGNAHAQYLMGGFLSSGRQGIESDPTVAFRWFQSASAQGYAPAQYRLGECYRHGRGVEKNSLEAVRFFQLAAQQGDLPARNALGELYFHGEGFEKSFEAALMEYRLAAEAGLATAQRNMGFMAAEGHGMVRDNVIAMDWYRKAAEQGDAVAISNIGLMYEHAQGVEADLLRAWDCYYQSSLWGYRGAKRHCDRVETSLPAEWQSKGLYERDGKDCLGGGFKKITRPVSRIRN